MANSNSRKIKLLKIWEILSQNTDEKNPMPTPVLIERLSEYGIMVFVLQQKKKAYILLFNAVNI